MNFFWKTALLIFMVIICAIIGIDKIFNSDDDEIDNEFDESDW